MSDSSSLTNDAIECHDTKWFAGLAMQAIIAKQNTVPDTNSEREEVALWSFRMGQAMSAMAKQLRVDDDR